MSPSTREAQAHRTAATTIVDSLAGLARRFRLQAAYRAHAGAQRHSLGS